jgi:hypothetical protein
MKIKIALLATFYGCLKIMHNIYLIDFTLFVMLFCTIAIAYAL